MNKGGWDFLVCCFSGHLLALPAAAGAAASAASAASAAASAAALVFTTTFAVVTTVAAAEAAAPAAAFVLISSWFMMVSDWFILVSDWFSDWGGGSLCITVRKSSSCHNDVKKIIDFWASLKLALFIKFYYF